MAITKTLIANGSKGYHKFTLNVTEARTSGNSSFNDYSFIMSPIQTGWDWYNHGGGISYEIKIGDKTFTGTIPAYNGSSTVILSSGSDIEIEHESDGTKTIDISFKVTDSTGATYTCGNASASGTMVLSALHTPPEITNVNISETNTILTNLGITNDTIVQYLSKKKFTITTTTYDDAKISSYSIYHNNVLIGTSTTNEITIDFSNVNELMTSGTNYVGLTIAVIDDKDGYSTRIFNFPVIKYTKPTIESTSTTIKRKTSGGTVLTDNKVLLNFVGTCYKGNDVIGNANKPTVQYKIWNTTEPSYTTVDSTNTANVTVTDYEISNIAYTSVYNYKIKIYDVFTNSSENPIEKISIVPTGVSVWSEYKDRVDFKKITINNINPFSYLESEQEVGIWIDGKTIYRKVTQLDTEWIAGNNEFTTNITNAETIINSNLKFKYNESWYINWDQYKNQQYKNDGATYLLVLNDALNVDIAFLITEYTKKTN